MPHVHEAEYPEDPPITCLTSAISIFRGGREKIVAERATLGLDCWNILGYAQRVVLGVPDEGPFGNSVTNEDQFTSDCRDLCVAANDAMGAQFSAQDFGARDWKALLKWFAENILPILIPIIFAEGT